MMEGGLLEIPCLLQVIVNRVLNIRVLNLIVRVPVAVDDDRLAD